MSFQAVKKPPLGFSIVKKNASEQAQHCNTSGQGSGEDPKASTVSKQSIRTAQNTSTIAAEIR